MQKSQAKKIVVSVSDLRIPKDYSLAKDGISQSLLGAWQTCPRRFLFMLNRWRNPQGERAFGYGSMMHEALDAVYSAAAGGCANVKKLEALGLEAIDVFKFPAIFSADEAEKMKAIGDAVLVQYLTHYRSDFKQLRFDKPERVFGVPFARVTLRGKIDGRFRDKNKGRWHLEHKNLSKINEDTMMKKLSFDLQNLFYIVADQIENGEPVNGVLYNVLRRPDVRKEMPVGKLREYVSGLIEADPGHYFKRWEIPYTQKDLATFRGELAVKLDRLAGNIASTQLYGTNPLGLFYKNECACEAPWPCNYLDACASGTLGGFKQTKTLFTELEPKTEGK